jgi:hypothetical protein
MIPTEDMVAVGERTNLKLFEDLLDVNVTGEEGE